MNDSAPRTTSKSLISALLPDASLLDAKLDGETVGELLNACRAYLMFVAQAEMTRELAVKVAPSDIVQETLLDAQGAFARFQGATREELFAWLRKILKNNVLNASRRYRETARRQLGLEIQLTGGSHQVTESKLVAAGPGPRSDAIQNEEEQRLLTALSRLPPIYQQVIELRNNRHLSFAEIAAEIGRSAEAARKLWSRGIEMLQAELC